MMGLGLGLGFSPQPPAASSGGLGPELLTNGGFTGGGTGWTDNSGGKWEFLSNFAIVQDPNLASGDSENLQQNVTLENGATYRVEFTILSYEIGDIQVNLGGTLGTNHNVDGTKSEDIVAGASDFIRFQPGSGDDIWRGVIDSVSVKKVL